MLSYHCICEAIASGMVKFFHIPGEINPADILSKHWGTPSDLETTPATLVLDGRYAEVVREETPQGSLQQRLSLNGETLPTKVVAIEPVLGSIKYEARSHYHSVFRGDCIHSRVSFICQRGQDG